MVDAVRWAFEYTVTRTHTIQHYFENTHANRVTRCVFARHKKKTTNSVTHYVPGIVYLRRKKKNERGAIHS